MKRDGAKELFFEGTRRAAAVDERLCTGIFCHRHRPPAPCMASSGAELLHHLPGGLPTTPGDQHANLDHNRITLVAYMVLGINVPCGLREAESCPGVKSVDCTHAIFVLML